MNKKMNIHTFEQTKEQSNETIIVMNDNNILTRSNSDLVEIVQCEKADKKSLNIVVIAKKPITEALRIKIFLK